MASSIDELAAIFRRFAEVECRDCSALYERLSNSIAADHQLLEIAAHGRIPVPNLFFAAVHYLLRRDVAAPLRRFYPSLSRDVDAATDPSEAFKAYCLRNSHAIIQILGTHRVQTNEVARCGYLLPSFALIQGMGGGRPLSLVEVGTSAGLHLCFDRYCYDYGDGNLYGDQDSELTLRIELRGPVHPPILRVPLNIAKRIGIDLNPICSNDSDSVEWLEALVWPEHQERRKQLQAALRIVRDSPVHFIAGNAVGLITDILDSTDSNSTICVFESATLNQFTPKDLNTFFGAIRSAAQARDVYLLSRQNQLTLRRYSGDGCQTQVLAETQAHGRWVRWTAGSRD